MPSKGLSIAYLGPPHSFHHLTALCHFGEDADMIPYTDPEAIAGAVSKGDCQFGILAVENSDAGRVPSHLEAIVNHNLTVTHQIRTEVELFLCGMAGGTLEDIHKVYSHPMAFKQCSRYFGDNEMECMETSSTSEAMHKVVSEGNRHLAALGNRQAAGVFGLSMLDGPLNNDDNNYTRFFVISRKGATERQDFSSIVIPAHTQNRVLQDLESLGTEVLRNWPLEGGSKVWLEVKGLKNHPGQITLIGSYPAAGICSDI